jgi:hypothetical protein
MLVAATEQGIIFTCISADNNNVQITTLSKGLSSPRVSCLKVSLEGRVFKVDHLKSSVNELDLTEVYDEKSAKTRIVNFGHRIVDGVVNAVTSALSFDVFDNAIKFFEGTTHFNDSQSTITIDEGRRLMYGLTTFFKKDRTRGVDGHSIVEVYSISPPMTRGYSFTKLFDITGPVLLREISMVYQCKENDEFGGWEILEVKPASAQDHPLVHLVIVFSNACRAFLGVLKTQTRSNTLEGPGNFDDTRKWFLYSFRPSVKLSNLQFIGDPHFQPSTVPTESVAYSHQDL